MKICFPIEADNGLESAVFGHFGSAPSFILYDTEKKESTVLNNQDLGHAHGMCSPLKALNGKEIDALVVAGIGAGAIQKLNQSGIKVYRACAGSLHDNLKRIEAGTIEELHAQHGCSGHSCS